MSNYRISVADLVAAQPEELRESAAAAVENDGGKPGYAGRLTDVTIRQALITAIEPGALSEEDLTADLGTSFEELLLLLNAVEAIEGITSQLLNIIEKTLDPAEDMSFVKATIIGITRAALAGPVSTLV